MRMVMHSGAALQPKSHGHNNEGGQQAQHGGERVFQMGSALLWHGMHTRAALREQNVSPDLLTRLCTAPIQAQQNHLPSLQGSQTPASLLAQVQADGGGGRRSETQQDTRAPPCLLPAPERCAAVELQPCSPTEGLVLSVPTDLSWQLPRGLLQTLLRADGV